MRALDKEIRVISSVQLSRYTCILRATRTLIDTCNSLATRILIDTRICFYPYHYLVHHAIRIGYYPYLVHHAICYRICYDSYRRVNGNSHSF